jgi:hypothetical protein
MKPNANVGRILDALTAAKKGRPFRPDERQTKILTDAAAATLRHMPVSGPTMITDRIRSLQGPRMPIGGSSPRA